MQGYNNTGGKRADLFLRLRGLPYSAGDQDVRAFFSDINVVEVYFVTGGDGRPGGECYVEFANDQDVNEALKKHQGMMGTRYIEIFPIGDVELTQILRKQQMKQSGTGVGCLRLRGLPFSAKEHEIITFFKDYKVEEVVFGKEPGEWGRPTGEAYVRFGSKQEAEKALQLNGQRIGHRYLELFRADGDAFELFKQRMSGKGGGGGAVGVGGAMPLSSLPMGGGDAGWGTAAGAYLYQDYGYDTRYGTSAGGPAPPHYGSYQRGGGAAAPPNYRFSPYDYHGRSGTMMNSGNYGGGLGGTGEEFITPTKVHMRGLPFRVNAKQIEAFFEPLQCVEIKLGYFDDGRSTGDGIVEFGTMAEAREALKKDHQTIGNRYVELFPSNTMRLSPGAYYKTVGGRMGGTAPPPAPLSATGYQWSSY